MPAPTVILTWQEKESSDEGQTVLLILFWFTDGSVCLSKTVGFDRLSLLINTGKFCAACCVFEERFFGFQPQNDIALSWFDFPHQTSSEPQSNSDPEFCRPSIVLGTTLILSKGRMGHAGPIEASPFRYPAACCGVFMGSTGKENADGPTSFLAMNYESSKVAAG